MKLCPKCLEEYEDNVDMCSDCDHSLVGEDELVKLGKRPERSQMEDTTAYVVAGSAESPFDADAFTSAIDDAEIPVLARMRRSSAVDALTETVQHAWWEILVPAEQSEKAAAIIASQKQKLKELEQEAEAAADEEERESEATGS